MRWTRIRASRLLLIILAVIFVLGAAVSAYQITKKKLAARPGAPVRTAAAPMGGRTPGLLLAAAPVDPSPARPAAAPATAPAPALTVTPSGPAGAPVPATRPVARSGDWQELLATGAAPASPPAAGGGRLLIAAAPAPAGAVVAPAVAGPTLGTLADGRTRAEAGDLVGARRSLTDALLGGKLSAADAAEARQLLVKINQALVFSTKRYNNDPFGGAYAVQSGEVLQRIAGKHDVTAELLCRINGLADPKRLQAGKSIKVLKGPFHAIVSKHAFTMDLYLGSPADKDCVFVTTFAVGLGKDDSTPTGTWVVEPQKKLKSPRYYSPRGEGVIEAGDPKNPLGVCWIGLQGIDGDAKDKSSYGIHGTIDPNSIGKQESLGCIRMTNENAMMVFEMLVEGKSTVLVKP